MSAWLHRARLGQEQLLPQACFNTHRALSQVSPLTVADYRALLADLAGTLLSDLAAEQVSFADQHSPKSVTDASLLLQIQ